MANPQQPELARSRKVPALDPDASETVLSASEPAPSGRAEGPVPEDNLPGHHPDHEQDKPIEAFVARARELAAEAHADAGEAATPAAAAGAEAGPEGAGEPGPAYGYPPPGAVPAAPPLPGQDARTTPSPLAQRVSGVATMPLRVAGRVLERLRDRL